MIHKNEICKRLKEEKKSQKIDWESENIKDLFLIKNTILNIVEKKIIDHAKDGYIIIYDNEFSIEYKKFINNNLAKNTLKVRTYTIVGFLAYYIGLDGYKTYYVEKKPEDINIPIGDPKHYNFGMLIVWDDDLDINKFNNLTHKFDNDPVMGVNIEGS